MSAARAGGDGRSGFLDSDAEPVDGEGNASRRSGAYVAGSFATPDSARPSSVKTREGCITLAADGTIVQVDEPAAVMLGLSSSECLGRSIAPWLAIDATRLRFLLDTSAPGDTPLQMSLRSQTRTLPAEITSSLPVGPAGLRLFYLRVGEVGAAPELHVPEARPSVRAREGVDLDAIFKGLPFALFVVTSDGAVTYLNQKAGALMTSAPDLVEQVRGQAVRAIRGQLVEPLEVTLTLADGVTAFFQLHTSTLQSHGHPSKAVVVAEDVTAERKAEEKRQVDEKFRELFVGILGHDLRTPLNSILAAAAISKQRAKSAEEVRLSDIMLRSCRRMGRLIEDILDMTQGRLGGGVPIFAERADLSQVVMASVDELEGAVPAGRFDVRIDGDTVGSWDAARLMQVLANLLKIATDYGEPSSRIGVHVDGRAPSHVTIAVKNQGPPIAADLLPVIFDPFRRGGRSGSRLGIGLGLYIVERIAAAHGGTISVRSSAGEGTTFLVTLPRTCFTPD